MKEVDFEGKKGFGKAETRGLVDVGGEEAFQVRRVIYREG